MVSILVIDDDLVLRMVLQKMLTEQGYQAIAAADGKEGLTLAKQHQPALIICDWLMPEINGLEVCRQVRADPDLAATFLILLTSLGDVADRVKGLDAGADDFLTKPIDFSELKARVRAGLRLYNLNQDLQRQKQLLEHQKQILEAELAEAATYVRSLLPPPLHSSVEINSQFIPSLQLGGDCFGYGWLDQDHLAIYLLDVSGHGIGSALLSVSVLNILRSQSLSGVDFYDPSAVLTSLNQNFIMQQQGGMYFTIWYGVYNQKTRRLTYAAAGHPPAVMLSDRQELWQLETLNIPIGFFPDVSFQTSCCEIPLDTEIYLFSDGIYEFGLSCGIFGLEQFIETLYRQISQASDLLDLRQLINQLRSYTPQHRFEDDVSILQIRFK
ncbi:MAG: SpoIIE family protein phosphatase [Pseudanabaenaceae cyanobacterium bins.68]|nr:SpoIIE family protein phosphatase [Pseudanabaenaceae cyanobacterium bins.68]